jgi:hypothetical protein
LCNTNCSVVDYFYFNYNSSPPGSSGSMAEICSIFKIIKMDKEFDILYWNDLKGKLKQEYPLLTGADLQWRHSSTDELLMEIALKLGKTFKEVKERIEFLV